MSLMLDSASQAAPLPDDVSDAESAPSILELLFDELSLGVVVIREDREILHVNAAARFELTRCSVLYSAGNELKLISPVDAKTLHSALERASAGKRSLVRLSASGMSLTLSVVPLRGDMDSPYRIALFFSRSGVDDSGMFDFFARSHGLTSTEQEVFVLLCRSLTTPEIAAQTKVAVSTVRSHVRSLCLKTGSSGVRELVNRIATLPPVGFMPQRAIH